MHARRPFRILSVTLILGFLLVLTGAAQAVRGEPARARMPLQAGALVPVGVLSWNTFLGSTSDDQGKAIAVDVNGDVYVAGYSLATWGSPVRPFAGGLRDAFVARVDSSGTLLWNTFLGSTSDDWGYAVAVDGSGNTYVAGNSWATWGSPVRAFIGGGYGDAFVAKLDNTGALVWNTFLGGSASDIGSGIALDGTGNIIVTGESDAGWGSPGNPYAGGNGDAFVAKLDGSGALVWNTFLGSAGSDYGAGIAVDGAGNISINGRSDATWGNPLRPFAGDANTDVFVAKLSSTGSLAWNTFLGGAGTDYGYGIKLDADGNAYIVGGSDAAWGAPVNPYTGGYRDAFVAKLDNTGALAWNTFLGGPGDDLGIGIALDAADNAYIVGGSAATWGTPVHPYAAGGYQDAFVAQLDNTGALAWNTFLGSAIYEFGNGIALDGAANIYITGGGTPVTLNDVDLFVAKLGNAPSISGNAGVVGAMLSYDDGSAETAIADASGDYSFLVPYGWSGTVTPSKTGYSFDPPSRSYANVTTDRAAQNFTSIQEAPSWNTFLGGGSWDGGYAVAVDANGNIYVAGVSNAMWGSPVHPFAGVRDAFVAKLGSNGTLLWNTFLGGSDDDAAHGIAVDAGGNIYVAGYSWATWGSPLRPFAGQNDAFVAKLDANGSLVWNTFLGGADGDAGFGIAVDANENAYVTGYSGATWGVPVRPYAGDWNAFVAKVDSSGALVWNTFLGSNTSTDGFGLLLDRTGNIYITGVSSGTWGSPVNPYAGGSGDAFVAKLDTTGALTWNAFLGSTSEDYGIGIAVDANGNTYVIGFSKATWGSPLRPFGGGLRDAFVAKLDSTGARLWNTFLGGTGSDAGFGIAVDAIGDIYVAGSSDAMWGSPTRPFTGGSDGFVAKLHSSSALVWNSFLGGAGDDSGFGIVVDGHGNVLAVGESYSSWGDPIRPFSDQSAADAFVAKLGSDESFTSISGNAGVGGAALSYYDGSDKTAIADSSGNYSFSVSYGWSGTVTPSKVGYIFDPPSRNYTNVTDNLSNQNFAASSNNAWVHIGSEVHDYYVPSAGNVTPIYPGLVNGPVEVTSSVNVFTSERTLYGGSFNEVMGYPNNRLSKHYWFPWYDQVNMQTWILVGNPSTTQTASVDIYIGGQKMNTTPYSIGPGGNITPQYAGKIGGPVEVTSNINVFTSERTLYGGSFNEVMGYPNEQLSQDYWFPWYDQVNMQTWVLVGNPSTTQTANVDIYIGGQKMNTTPYSIDPGGSITPQYLGKVGGPVEVKSDIAVFASERALYGSSFNEVMGYPNEQLTNDYWFPWYDGANMATWVLVGRP